MATHFTNSPQFRLIVRDLGQNGEIPKTLIISRSPTDNIDAAEIPLSKIKVEGGSTPPSNVVESKTVYGVVGFITLQNNEYIIVITDRERIGTIKNADVYRVKSVSVVSITRNNMTPNQAKSENIYLQKLEDHFDTNNMYFSYGYDLTQSLQRQASTSPHPGWKQADPRFFWNHYLCEKMMNGDDHEDNNYSMSDFILPIMQGFISINRAQVHGHPFAFALLSRRSRLRAGTRYFSRGIDKDGNVSNFVETEQLVIYDGSDAVGGYDFTGRHQMSYIQTRGSIPVFWSQVINMRYTPKLWLDTGDDSLKAMKTHFKDQVATYGPQILVNLVNKKGYEYPLAQAYSQGVIKTGDPNLTYIHFDFHHECRKMRWDRIKILIDQIEGQLEQQGYCYYNATNSHKPFIEKAQTSVVRSNCMDCLDRTNVVQSAIAKWVLSRQLQQLQILRPGEIVDEQIDFMHLYRKVWADNADAISLGYSGTGALKTDYTRTGKRTKTGAFEDLTKSLMRYVKNNYMDGARQDGFDLALGVYRVSSTSWEDSPYNLNTPLIIHIVPLVVLLSAIMCIFGVMLISYSGITSTTLICLFIAFWFSLLVTTFHYMLQNSQCYVDWPRLVAVPGQSDSNILKPSAEALTSTYLPRKFGKQAQRRSSKELSALEEGDQIPLKKMS
ncbi:hypothetical protein INT44_000048 [Umbelopsis vinacea]|uniref:SAC domain-containing protein n=1 Tax=Umbelopsis vinacea TaxID=44442 RepID=A0A8H7PHR1_9FUNG|nr:hypothetical protein INT44_000048 [Umbelopsis vinacea]